MSSKNWLWNLQNLNLKTIDKTPFYRLPENRAVGAVSVLSVDRRSTGQRSFFWPLQPPVDRLGRPNISREQISLERSTASRPDLLEQRAFPLSVDRLGRLMFSREQGSLGRSTDPVDRPLCWQRAQGCAHRSTGPVDRFGLSASLQVRKMDLKSFIKS